MTVAHVLLSLPFESGYTIPVPTVSVPGVQATVCEPYNGTTHTHILSLSQFEPLRALSCCSQEVILSRWVSSRERSDQDDL